MSKSEILAGLSKLNAEERTEVFERLCELQEEDLLHGVGPTGEEKKLLDEALADYEKNPDAGSSWQEVKARIQAKLRP